MGERYEIAIEKAVNRIASALLSLGKESSGDPRGAVEFLGQQIKEGLDGVAESLSEIASAIRGTKES